MFLYSIDLSEALWPVDGVRVELIERCRRPIDVIIRRESPTDGAWSFTRNRCHVTAWQTTWLG
jgi:hypothetical protein